MDTQKGTKQHTRKTYTPPKLVKYGEVRSLTQGGTAGINEGGSTLSKKLGSDRKIKENIVRIGVHPLGIGLYLFDYKREYREPCGHGRQFGVMADEVETVMPEAVSIHPAGHKIVDYGMLAIRRNGR